MAACRKKADRRLTTLLPTVHAGRAVFSFGGTVIAELLAGGMLHAISLMLKTLLTLSALGFALSASAATERLRIISPASFAEGTRIPLRLERLKSSGAIDKDSWSVPGILVFERGENGTAVTNAIEFRNGLALFSIEASGTNDYRIVVSDSENSSSPRVIPLASTSPVMVGGTLSGSSTIWSGIVRVTNDVTIPENHTLRIEPGTLVLVDGADSGSSAPDLLVEGTVESVGTEDQPVWITSAGNGTNWGQIRHSSGSAGFYRYTFIHKGGRTAGEGHTGTGPVLRLSGADVQLENCLVSDLWTDRAIGKGMFARNSDLVLNGTVFAQMRMGPEIEGTSLYCTNSFFTEMRGPDDCDGIYLHDADGKSLRVVDSVFIGGDDDAIDTLSSDVTVSDCIFRGWLNEGEDAKAISVFNGRVDVRRCLIADCFSGISAKTTSDNSAVVNIDHSTIVTKTNGVAAAWKSNATGPDIAIHVTNSIVIGNPSLSSAFGTTNVLAGYSIISSEWAGQNVTVADPHFFDAVDHDYRLLAASPAIDAGDPAAPRDDDGTRSDIGYTPFEAQLTSASIALVGESLSISLSGMTSGQTIVTETSADLKTWSEFERTVANGSIYNLSRPVSGDAAFFRFRIE